MRKLFEKFGAIMDDTQDAFDRMLTGQREFTKPDGSKLVIGERASTGLVLLGGMIALFGGRGSRASDYDYEDEDGEETED